MSWKIDRQFVSELEQSTRQQELLKVIVGIAKAFELDLVAEGIETAKQAKLLTQFGCRLGQGFFYARPMPHEATLANPSNSSLMEKKDGGVSTHIAIQLYFYCNLMQIN